MPNLSHRQIAVAPSHSSPLCCFRSFPSVSMEIWLWIVWFIFMICYIYLAKLSIFLCSVPHPHSPDLSTSSSFFALVIPFYLSFSFFFMRALPFSLSVFHFFRFIPLLFHFSLFIVLPLPFLWQFVVFVVIVNTSFYRIEIRQMNIRFLRQI